MYVTKIHQSDTHTQTVHSIRYRKEHDIHIKLKPSCHHIKFERSSVRIRRILYHSIPCTIRTIICENGWWGLWTWSIWYASRFIDSYMVLALMKLVLLPLTIVPVFHLCLYTRFQFYICVISITKKEVTYLICDKMIKL